MKLVTMEVDGKIGTITINREKALNALNEEVLDALDVVLDEVESQDIWAVILRGAGERAFVAGADIAQMQGFSQSEARAFGSKGNAIFRKLETLTVPVIAAVHGFALGGGCELAMACDIRLAADSAVFGQPETGLGITPGFGGTQRLMRLVGMGKAKEMIYAGVQVKAEEAKELGLVNAVYSADQLMDEAVALAEKIVGNAPIAVRACKKAMNEGADTDMVAGLSIETELFGDCFETQDQVNAMTAFTKREEKKPFENK